MARWLPRFQEPNLGIILPWKQRLGGNRCDARALSYEALDH